RVDVPGRDPHRRCPPRRSLHAFRCASSRCTMARASTAPKRSTDRGQGFGRDGVMMKTCVLAFVGSWLLGMTSCGGEEFTEASNSAADTSSSSAAGAGGSTGAGGTGGACDGICSPPVPSGWQGPVSLFVGTTAPAQGCGSLSVAFEAHTDQFTSNAVCKQC